LLMRDGPGGISTPTALAFRGADSTQAAPLPHREFRLTQQASQLLGRVPFLRLLPLDQQGEQALDSIQPLLEPHTCSHFSFHFPPTERDDVVLPLAGRRCYQNRPASCRRIYQPP